MVESRLIDYHILPMYICNCINQPSFPMVSVLPAVLSSFYLPTAISDQVIGVHPSSETIQLPLNWFSRPQSFLQFHNETFNQGDYALIDDNARTFSFVCRVTIIAFLPTKWKFVMGISMSQRACKIPSCSCQAVEPPLS